MPPTDPRYLDATLDEIVLDLYTWAAANDPNDQMFEDDDFNPDDLTRELGGDDLPDDFEEVK